MPSVLSHPAVPVAIACFAGRDKIHAPLLVAGVIASVLPDADVLSFKCGIPYGHFFGHRGFFHSLSFSLLLAIVGTSLSAKFGNSPRDVFTFLFVAAASHGLLDAATNGGLGVAIFSPISNHRFFLPWRPIVVSPLSIGRTYWSRLSVVAISELKWVWLPAVSLAAIGFMVRRKNG